MRYVKTGARVRWMDGDRQLTGTIFGPARNKLTAGVRVDAGGTVVVAKNRLRPALDRVLILESRLDASLRSGRQCGDLYSTYLQRAHNIRPLYDRINTSDDLNAVMEAHAPAARIVLISCHGESDKHGTRLALSRDKVHLRRGGLIVADQPWLQALAGKIVILSCCEIGADQEALTEVARRNRIELLVAYADTLFDRFSFVAETALLDRFITEPQYPQQLIRHARAMAEVLHRHGYDHVHPSDRSRGFRKPAGPVMRVFGPR